MHTLPGTLPYKALRITTLCLGLAVLGGCALDPKQPETSTPDLSTNLRLGQVALETNDPQTAEAIYGKAAKMNPAAPRAWIGLGRAALLAGNTEKAIGLFSKAIEVNPQLAAGHQGLGQALLRSGQLHNAVKSFTAAAQLKDATATVFSGLGVSLDALGRHTEAQQAYNTGLQKFPAALTLHNNRAFSLAITGDLTAAIKDLTPFAENPTAPHQLKLNMALLHGVAGNMDKAKYWAEQVLTSAETQKNMEFYKILRALPTAERAKILLDLATD